MPKEGDAVKFGILGASKIAPVALLHAARTHPEVVVQAVAARDKSKAAAYAKKHGIPQVLDSYQGTSRNFRILFDNSPSYRSNRVASI